MKIPKRISFLAITISTTLSLAADELKFNNFKYDQFKEKQSIYEPKDKLDEYIIKGATHSTKFIPLMNDGSNGSDYTNIMSKDAKRLLVDKGFNFVNSTANSQIQKIPFFAQTTFNFSGGTEANTSFSINSLMKLGELANDDDGDITKMKMMIKVMLKMITMMMMMMMIKVRTMAFSWC